MAVTLQTSLLPCCLLFTVPSYWPEEEENKCEEANLGSEEDMLVITYICHTCFKTIFYCYFNLPAQWLFSHTNVENSLSMYVVVFWLLSQPIMYETKIKNIF